MMKKKLRNEKLHDSVRDYIRIRIDYSERAMQRFHSRWQANELRLQAFINHPEKEKEYNPVRVSRHRG